MEPSQPVDPRADQTPAIPQARRSGEEGAGAPEAPSEVAGESAAEAASEAAPGEAGGGEAGGGEAGGGEEKQPSVWNVRSVFLIVLAVVMALGLVGFVGGYLFYHRASEPERSTPGVAVRQYVEAAFNDRDQRLIRRWTCGGGSAVVGDSQALLDYITARESTFNVKINVAAEDIVAHTTGDRATVTSRLHLSAVRNGRIQEQIQSWEFVTEKHSGWRVCDSRQLAG